MYFLFRPLRLLLKAVMPDVTAEQLSMGFACGFALGIVPKDNLLAVGLGVLFAATRINLGVMAATALFTSAVAGFADPLADAVGAAVLTAPSLVPYWTSLWNQPFVPWTNFNQTAVTGSLLIGLASIYPLHRASLPGFRKALPIVKLYSRKFRLVRVLTGAEWADGLGTVNG